MFFFQNVLLLQDRSLKMCKTTNHFLTFRTYLFHFTFFCDSVYSKN